MKLVDAAGCAILRRMLSGPRATVVALAISSALVAAATVLVPPRTRLGSHSFVCDSVLTPRPFDPIATAICQMTGAYRLRATVAIAVLVFVLCFIPMLLERTRFSASRPGHVIWASTVVIVIVLTVALLAVVGARFDQVFFDL